MEEVIYYLIATVPDMNGHYSLLYREFVASVPTKGRKTDTLFYPSEIWRDVRERIVRYYSNFP